MTFFARLTSSRPITGSSVRTLAAASLLASTVNGVMAASFVHPGSDRQRVQAVVDAFRARLALWPDVTVMVVAENPLLVSVEPPSELDGPYRLSFEARFLDQLTDADLRAVVAHELGHVWIFTHHPYLQTEALANAIAERLVSRVSLERVYARVWEQGVPKGNVQRFTP
jgi:hypothetical protein